jgi:glycosyltransferase 2 family protein
MAVTWRPRSRTRALVVSAGGVAVLVFLVLRVGAAPFQRGLAAVTPGAIAVAAALSALATVAAAVRWRLVARSLRLPLGVGEAIGAYYGSQLLNAVLPGGVLGDAQRAVAHGRSSSTTAAARAIVAERTAGQLAQGAIGVAALAALAVGGAVTSAWLAVAIWFTVLALPALALGIALAASARMRRIARREWTVIRPVLAEPARALAVVALSAVVVASHVATFAVAAAAVGIPLGWSTVAVAAATLLVASIPLNVAGWGPRETAAAGLFAAVGAGSAAGVAASTAFGVLTLIAVLPGAITLLVAARRRPRHPEPAHRVRPASLHRKIVAATAGERAGGA